MITQTLTTSFKKELLEGIHNFATDTFKLALYTSSASIGADTTVYSTTGEVLPSNAFILSSSGTYNINYYLTSGWEFLLYYPGATAPPVSAGQIIMGDYIPAGTTVVSVAPYDPVEDGYFVTMSNANTNAVDTNLPETVSFYDIGIYNGYYAGGNTLTVVGPSSDGTTAYVSFNNTTWANNSSFTALGGLIYNSSKSNKSVAVLNFGNTKTALGTFTVQFPAATASTAIIRIS